MKSIAITKLEQEVYDYEAGISKMYEERDKKYDELLERLESLDTPIRTNGEPVLKLCLDICRFLLKNVQFRKFT